MTEQMEKMLIRAASIIGAAGSKYTFEAQKLGWVKFNGTPQNSTTSRYKITPAGEEALREFQAAA